VTATITSERLPEGAHRDLGLTDDELDAIQRHLGRDPTFVELAMFSVMWSEHCSYKSSRIHLKTLPTEGPQVLVGPGEGAGVVEVAPGVAVAWKIESHNHPSFVEPFNGAATGVGGIVRDVLSMGARPIALMDPLRFGPLDDAHSAYLVDGVVHGISSYGNSIGVPTVGGEVVFDECYAANPLVNVACLGVVEHKLMKGVAERPGDKLVLFGSATGRDGIGGASVLASATFDEESHSKRPSVQVGDPFSEKLLIEASLELVRRDLIVGFQDLGAGGISCPASEMPAKSDSGVSLDASKVHLREADMEPFEIMISESQERMLAVVDPTKVDDVLAVCAKWELQANVVGEVTSTRRMNVTHDGKTVADAPVRALAEEGPVYERPLARPQWIDDVQASEMGDRASDDLERAFIDVLTSPTIASKRWVWEQYDHMIFLGTIVGPGADAAVIRLPGRSEAVAITTDGPGRFCYLDPYEGARLAVAEAARNVACTGASPLAVTNCLNFGSPEREDVMWQFAEVVLGIGNACRDLGTPVTGGNVSFYNETNGNPIYPTPVIGMLGSIEEADRAVGIGFTEDDLAIVLLGATDGTDFGGSEYAKVIHGAVGGRPPRLDIEAEKNLLGFLQAVTPLVDSSHDLSKGGLAVALAESAFKGGRGFRLSRDFDHRELFAESPSRAMQGVAPQHLDSLLNLAAERNVPAEVIGTTGGTALDFGSFATSLKDALDRWESAIPAYLSARVEG
jgi:phosphoribosylformylglycinamidine synthase subunit PurL